MEIDQYLAPSNFYLDYTDSKDIDEITQGDIIFSEESNKLFIVVTNACDLENRSGKRKSQFIHLLTLKPVNNTAFSFYTKEQWANITGQNDNSSMFVPFHKLFGIEECYGFLIYAGFLITEDIIEFLKRTDIKIVAQLRRPYLDLLSWKIGYLFNRIPVDQPEKSVLRSWHDDLNKKFEDE